jgi:tRNA U34 5-methylaminomethyl-2-thiouridine-forming methyltransferase MnmC
MIELVRTEDGSLSRFDEETGELYHNRAGAYTEALRNYYEPSDAKERLQRAGELRLLDACFGLGYNTFVLLAQLINDGCQGNVVVHAVETDSQILSAIPQVLADDRLQRLAQSFTGAPLAGFGKFLLSAGGLNVSIDVIEQDLRLFARDLDASYDIVFHDPFSPRKVPELWIVDVFLRYYQALLPTGGQVLTYSTAGAVRGGLRGAGFKIFRTAAVGGKSGGTLASADPAYVPKLPVKALSGEEVKHLLTRSCVPYRDPTFTQLREDIVLRREHEQALR